MAQRKCNRCGVLIPDTMQFCPQCGARQSAATRPPMGYPHRRSGSKTWLWIVLAVIGVAIIAGGAALWYYNTKYLPEKRDREALRTYPMVNVQIRSTKEADGAPNSKLVVGPGAELITYEMDDEWATVKYISPTGEVTEGYVRSPYLLGERESIILQSILSDADVRADIETSKVRRALLDYFMDHGYFGDIPDSTQRRLGLKATADNQWHVRYHHGKKRPNEAMFTRLVDPKSKYQDMAILIENITNGDRRILYFSFDTDETPHLIFQGVAPRTGDIEDIMRYDDGFGVWYSEPYYEFYPFP